MKILVTGTNGQLGSEIKFLEKNHPEIFPKDTKITYTDYQELDITKPQEVINFFEKELPNYCINCAAYTAVDKAEEESEKAYQINTAGAKSLAIASKKTETTLFHISTDFVFNGKKSRPYKEFDLTGSESVYGRTKEEGEKEVLKNNKESFVIRTSWLFSTFGNNFVKTMLKLGNEKDELNIVADQTGTPTYARDLAKAIITLINKIERKEIELDKSKYGIYHYSNEGTATWYDFTKAIFELEKIKCKVKPIDTEDYPTPAKRPEYSVLNKNKIKGVFGIEIPYWRDSLREMLTELKSKS